MALCSKQLEMYTYAHKYINNTKKCQIKSFFLEKNSKYTNRMQKNKSWMNNNKFEHMISNKNVWNFFSFLRIGPFAGNGIRRCGKNFIWFFPPNFFLSKNLRHPFFDHFLTIQKFKGNTEKKRVYFNFQNLYLKIRQNQKQLRVSRRKCNADMTFR